MPGGGLRKRGRREKEKEKRKERRMEEIWRGERGKVRAWDWYADGGVG